MHHLLRANDYFCVFHLRWQSIIFFPIASCYFSKLSLSEECNGLWLKFHSEKLSEIHVVYLMGKIIARQMKQSMTHSNQGDWRKTQVSKEVRLFTLSFATITHSTPSFTHPVTLSPDWSVAPLLSQWFNFPLHNLTNPLETVKLFTSEKCCRTSLSLHF